MSTASITRKEALALRAFCQKFNVTEVEIKKERGAYFCANSGSEEEGNLQTYIQYLDGMNPNSTSDNNNYCDWHDRAQIKFGADDFRVVFPAKWLDKLVECPKLSRKRRFSIRLQKKSVTLLM